MASSGQQQLTTQLDHLTARYEGTGHADMTRHEWATHQHRDAIASYLGHASMVEYFALAEGISVGRARLNLLERLHRPVGEPPASDADETPTASGAAQKPPVTKTGTVDRPYP
jgi:splicing factor 3B subunit 5